MIPFLKPLLYFGGSSRNRHPYIEHTVYVRKRGSYKILLDGSLEIVTIVIKQTGIGNTICIQLNHNCELFYLIFQTLLCQ